ncbi:hypothetical protein DPX16_21311 [Anabarilius grahami]|uniref:Uncharacterized protein n=1 Tax=Anabarilius grahami TaxID=495550 RepID=A0A3N0Y0S2_ANAGA|nr:hypothetical protein DPX16_21311 [Anabarilius grahami]
MDHRDVEQPSAAPVLEDPAALPPASDPFIRSQPVDLLASSWLLPPSDPQPIGFTEPLISSSPPWSVIAPYGPSATLRPSSPMAASGSFLLPYGCIGLLLLPYGCIGLLPPFSIVFILSLTGIDPVLGYSGSTYDARRRDITWVSSASTVTQLPQQPSICTFGSWAPTSWLLPPSSPPRTVDSVELWVCAIGRPPPVPSGSHRPAFTISLSGRPTFTIPFPHPATIASPHPRPPPSLLPMPSFHYGARLCLAEGGHDVIFILLAKGLLAELRKALWTRSEVHENLEFIVEKLHGLKLLERAELESLAEETCCNPTFKPCMYAECKNCKLQDLKIQSGYDGQTQVSYVQWTTETVLREKKSGDSKEKLPVNITVKREMESSLEDLIETFHKQLKKFKRHLFNIKTQFNYYRELKKNMKSNECLIHIDFSENYSCKFHKEIQAVHCASSHQQATLHTGVLYIGGEEDHLCFTTISPCKEKGPPAIWAHLSPVLNHLKETCPTVSIIHFFSDGSCSQYRQKGNFYMLTTELYNQGFTAGTWNFFEASHGKGAPDGVGGLLKRTADRLVSQGEDNSTAKHLFNALVNTNTAVKIFYIEEATVEKAIQQMPQRLPAVPCTMRIHQVITQAPGKLTYRDVSYLCSTRQILQCQCYQAQAFDFKVNSAVRALHQEQPDLEVQWDRDDIVGQWCVIRYDDEVYPGTIVEVSETHVHVKCMQSGTQSLLLANARGCALVSI